MCRKGNTYVFFDSKSFCPKAKNRLFCDDSIERDMNRLVETIIQVYKHLKERFIKEYNFFQKTPTDYATQIFGIVIIQENSGIVGDDIYKIAAKGLEIEVGSDKYRWLCAHVKMATITNIEDFCFSKTSIIEELIKATENEEIAEQWLHSSRKKNIEYKPYDDFIDQCLKKCEVDLVDIEKKIKIM